MGEDMDGKQLLCRTITLSAAWNRLKEELIAVRQRWYCPCCLARYSMKHGMMVELIMDDKVYYWKAPYPSERMLDLKAMMIERQNPNAKTVEELVAVLINARPVDRTFLFQAREANKPYTLLTETWGFDADRFENMPAWDWLDMLRLNLAAT